MADFTTRKWLRLLFDPDGTPSAEERYRLFFRIVEKMNMDFDSDLAAQLLSIMFREIKSLQWDHDDLLRELRAQIHSSPMSNWLADQLDIERLWRMENFRVSDLDQLRQLVDFEKQLPGPVPDLCLKRANLLAKTGQFDKSVTALRQGFASAPDYSFYLKSQSLVSQLLSNATDHAFRRSIRLAVLGSCTTQLLVPVLKAAALARGIRLEIYAGPYGKDNQEILNSESPLYKFHPDVVFLLLESNDLNPGPTLESDAAHEYAERIRELQKILKQRSGSHLILTGLNVPPLNSWGGLEFTLSNGRRRMIEKINQLLTDDLEEGISFLHPEQLAAMHNGSWSSLRDWIVSKQYPAPDALPVLANSIAAHLAALYGLTKKVLVLDLDNTCWGGVIGEDGLNGLELGSGSSMGESCLYLQRYAKELQRKGILLAVCSKNNEADALLPFEHLDEMILKRDDFTAFRANWKDKASNIRSIAEELNLGLDVFVFIDDNPVERAHVRRHLPEVMVPEFDDQHWKIVPTLQHSLFFETIALTGEDLKRHESYRLRAKSLPQPSDVKNMDDFLRSLKMTGKVLPVDEKTCTRVTQLVNKSNQFNLTTHRFNFEQVREMGRSNQWWCRAFQLTDRYQNHGIVGILFAKIEGTYWTIDTLVMSCRVIGRRLEDLMLATLLHDAKHNGAEMILGTYIPSDRNSLVRDFYKDHGFVPTGEDNQWHFELSRQEIPDCSFISVEELLLSNSLPSDLQT